MKRYLFCTACGIAILSCACDRTVEGDVEVYGCPNCNKTIMTCEMGWEVDDE